MKKILYIILCIILTTGCEDLNIEPLDQIGSESVFSDPDLLQAYFNNLHGRIPFDYGHGSYSEWMLASITDEASSKSGWPNSNRIRKGEITPTNSSNMGIWGDRYRTINIANTILKGLESSPLSKEKLEPIEGKVRFVRAWAYFTLVRSYGDIALIKEVQSPGDDLLVGRSTTSEVYDFIYEDLVASANLLSNKSDLLAGEISKQAAIALNARAMMYAERWAISSTLADLIITGSDNDNLDLHPNYRELFLSKGGNQEVVFEKLTSLPSLGHSWGRVNWPVRWRSDAGGQTCPSQQMVDSYEMAATGLSISNPASGYNPERPYDGRDKRFYASIFYHGSEFSEVAPSRGLPYIDMEYNKRNEGPGANKDGNASITGYLVKKFADPSDGWGPLDNKSSISWKEIRFAEVLLIYAEAENEAKGPNDKIYDALNRIRLRAGLPNLQNGLSQEQMRQTIRQERKVELAFENHRWHDLIRWGIAKEVLDGYEPRGVKVTRKEGEPGFDEESQIFDPVRLNFELNWQLDTRRDQVFPDHFNLLPIPQSELDKNSNLTQNSGY